MYEKTNPVKVDYRQAISQEIDWQLALDGQKKSFFTQPQTELGKSPSQDAGMATGFSSFQSGQEDSPIKRHNLGWLNGSSIFRKSVPVSISC